MSDTPAPQPSADVLDDFGEKLRAFNALRKSDKAAADAILTHLGGHGPVEQTIVRDLALPRPIYIPGRFDEAHRLVMRSLEVLKRNGSRSVKLEEGIGPIRGIAAVVVQFFMRQMVQRYIAAAIGGLDDLYTRRSTWTTKGSTEADMLQRARLQVARVAPACKGKKASLPSFLLGGAAISSVLSAGTPPSDTSFTFALYALVAMAVAWVVVPVGLYFLFN